MLHCIMVPRKLAAFVLRRFGEPRLVRMKLFEIQPKLLAALIKEPANIFALRFLCNAISINGPPAYLEWEITPIT